MFDFPPGIAYFSCMNLTTHKTKFGLYGILVLIIYSISLFLTPWFHLHPGEHHSDSTRDIYHSHSDPFVSHPSDHDEDNHQEEVPISHFPVAKPLLDDLVGIARVNPGSIINPSKFPPVADVLIPPTSFEICQNQPAGQSILYLVPPQCQRDYSVHSATNLSPPQA